MKNVVRVRNEAQRVLLEDELKGQISDGYWENAPGTGWEDWCNAEVIVDPDNVGRNFYARKDNFNLCAPALLDVVGDRMVESVQALGGAYEGYDMAAMKADLKDLKTIFRTKIQPTDEDIRKGVEEEQARIEARRRVEAKKAELNERVKELVGGYVSTGQHGSASISWSSLEKLLDLIPVSEVAG